MGLDRGLVLARHGLVGVDVRALLDPLSAHVDVDAHAEGVHLWMAVPFVEQL